MDVATKQKPSEKPISLLKKAYTKNPNGHIAMHIIAKEKNNPNCHLFFLPSKNENKKAKI